jgi:hypothetical protein
MAIQATIYGLLRNHTWDFVDRPVNIKMVDSQLVFKIKLLADISVDKFNTQLVAKGFCLIQEKEYNKTFGMVGHFATLCLLLAIIASNGIILQQLEIKAVF